MSGGGGGTTNTTVTNQNIPDEAMPYFTRALDRGEAASNEPYQPYGGARIADTSADTTRSYDMIRDIAGQGTPGADKAIGIMGDVAGAASDIGNRQPYQFSDAGTFSGDAIGQYMSPYMQQVVDAQKASALEDFQIANARRASDAVNAGAFGGSRSAVQQGLAERDLLSRTNQIQAEGLQKSYEDAAGLFEADRAARMKTDEARAGENLNYANLGLDSLKLKADAGASMADLEAKARAEDITAAQLLASQGKGIESKEQAGLDLSYEDFLNQRDDPMSKLERYTALLYGSPLGNTRTTTNSVPTNPVKDYLGMGISALGLYKAMG